MAELIEVTSGLRFPEGPVAMPDGSVVLVEMFGPRVTRVLPDGSKETVAEVPGGPNGLALGPNGLLYVCNNGGRYSPVDLGEWLFPGPYRPDRYTGGRIQTLDPATGQIEDLYTECDGRPLWSPNDLVFDAHGGFYFTDHGLTDDAERIHHLSGIFYAAADGSSISEVVFPAHEPNGIGLSPDGATLYWAQTWHGRIMRREVSGPGQLVEPAVADPSQCLHGFDGLQLLDSLAVDVDGNVCVATIVNGGVSVVSPKGELIDFVPTGDPITTNVCFGHDDPTTAYITLSATGRLVKTTAQWLAAHAP